jgi:hypothetical protein
MPFYKALDHASILHDGKPYSPGDVIELTEDQAEPLPVTLLPENEQKAAAQQTFTMSGKPARDIVEPERVLTVAEIETMLADTRTIIQEAVMAARGIPSLADMAAILTDHVAQVKTRRWNTVLAEIDQPIPVHLLCLKYGLPYNDAEILLALNKIPHPTFVSGKVLVHVR